jgi:Flp pilus assembly protein TadD
MHPIEIDAILKLAKTHLRSGKIPEAEQMYVRVLKEQPACAEALHFLGLAAMQRGKLDKALELVRRSIEIEPARADFHNNLATVLGRMNASVEALGAAQRAIDLRDDFAEAWSNKGVALEKLGRLDEAVEAYRHAVAVREDYAEALANLGNALSRMGQHEEACTRLRRVAELRPRDGGARKNLGNALRRAGKPVEAVVAYRMATDLNPRDADAYNNLGAALQEAGKVVEAETALRSALSIDPNHKDAHWNLGLALLALGRWREGWVEYEWRRHLREDLGQKRGFPQPAWQGSPLEGMHVLVLCEQGMGDSIQFVRYVPMLAARGAKVTVECQAKLKPLLSCLDTADKETGRQGDKETLSEGDLSSPCLPVSLSPCLPRRGEVRVIARGEPLPNFDMHARLMTLPCIFGSTPEDLPNQVPYLSVDEKRVSEFAEQFGSTQHSAPSTQHSPFTVGLVWQGNTAHKGDRFRSIPLAMFEPIAEVPGVKLVSLQKGYGHEQIEQNRERFELIEWSDPTDTTAEALVDTAAVMKNLDLVIAVDTSLAHLAGAMGVPVWVAMPLASDWRWLTGREDTPWYPTMRLFRQKKLGEWGEVIERMAEALAELVVTQTADTEECEQAMVSSCT